MSMLAHIERQQDELAELRKDKARLDWMDGEDITLDVDLKNGYKVTLDVFRGDCLSKKYEAMRLRRAIDKAMEECDL